MSTVGGDWSPGHELAGEHIGRDQVVRYGPGTVRALGGYLAELGVRAPLLVTGRSLAAGSLLEIVRDAAGVPWAGVFADASAHAPIAAIRSCADEYARAGADGLVAFGGGSPIEVARGVAMLRWDERGGQTTVTADPHPLVAISTTLAQAEFTKIFGFRTESGYKEVVRSAVLGPSHAILDAELTASTPERLWIASGVKAVDTGLATLTGRALDAVASGGVLEAICNLIRLLPRCRAEPGDIGVRQALQLAAWGCVFPIRNIVSSSAVVKVWLGSAARHQLGGRTGAPHSELSCVLLPTVVDHHAADLAPYADRLGAALDASASSSLSAAFADWLRRLDVVDRLGSLGVAHDDIASVVEQIVHESPLLSADAPGIETRLRALV